MRRALVLNASYEPLSVVPARRAVVLLLADKVDVVSVTDVRVRSERMSIPVPSVVRLRHFVRVPFARRAPLNRRAVFARDGGRCQYCGDPADSIDHVVPRAKGGAHTWDNVVAACRPCNVRKRDRLLSETSMVLRVPPRVPTGHSWVSVSVNAVPADWEPYLALESALSA